MKYYRDKVVNVMKSWLGKNENDGSFKVIIDTYNDIKPLPVGYKVAYTDEWCAATVSAAYHEVGYDAIYPAECSCPRMINNAKSMGIWNENKSYVPQAGDTILYDWESDGVADHIGMVISVANGKITVIEGNVNRSVAERVVAINDKSIKGFITPKFTASTSTSKTSSTKTVQEVAKEVIAGKWGSGAERKTKLTKAGYNYDEVQAEVNKMLSGNSQTTVTQTKKTNIEIAKEVIRGEWGSGSDRKNRLEAAGYNYSTIQALVNSML